MPSYTSSILVALAASAAQAIPRPVVPRSGEGIQWGECGIETEGLPVECAKLPVPLDYSDDSCEETLELNLIRYPAQNGPSKGSILLNFGGPGQDGLNNMIGYAPIQGPATGGQFDLISWDPRGTGQTLRFACFEPEEAGAALAQGSPDESPEVRQQVWDEAGYIAGNCSERLSDIGGLVGMAFTARDMMQIVDALGEDGKLRYWGVSGGTTLGATAAALFPDRMDKVILDGVMNAHEYYHEQGETNLFISSDDTLKAYLDACFDNPTKCALASIADSPKAGLEAIEGLFEQLKAEPILYPIPDAEPVPFTYSSVNTLVISLLYRPGQYQILSIILTALITGELDGLDEAFGGGGDGGDVSAVPREAEAVMGIRCGDKIPRADELADLEELDAEFMETSEYFGGFARGFYTYACAQWPFEAKERYEGDFQVKTSSPLLFIGNTYDPVTPLASAKNMSASFEGSVVLHQDSFGHTSIAQESDCTNEIIANYFLDGTLPEEGTVCEPNDPLFANDEELSTGGEGGEAPTSTEEGQTEQSPAETEEAEAEVVE